MNNTLALRHSALIATILLGLLPLLWFEPGKLITGGDIDFPLFPDERLKERSYVWYPGSLGGTDRSNNVASLPHVALEAFVRSIGISLNNVQRITYCAWFMLSGLSMYYLMATLVKKSTPFAGWARFTGVLFYLVNFYQMFLWVRLQLAIHVMILLPILVALFIKTIERQRVSGITLLALALVTVVSSPIGIQPPLIMIVWLSMLILALTYGIWKKPLHAWMCVSNLKYLGIFLIVFLLSSAFWVVPLASFIVNSGFLDSSVGETVYNVRALLKWVSTPTGFLNVFRHMGDVVWFDSWGKQAYFPEFLAANQNPFFIITSFIMPAAAFGALLIRRIDLMRRVFPFAVIGLVGLFLSKGSHEPFGDVYEWMMNYIPFFWIHRAPWQKFALMTVFAFSVLGGFSAATLGAWISRFVEKKWKGRKVMNVVIPHGVLAVFAILYVMQHDLFVRGAMFPSNAGNAGYHKFFNVGFHQSFPQYIFDAREWMRNKRDYFKILLLPDDRTNVYSWGYAAPGDASILIFRKGLLTRQYGEGFAPPHSVESLHGLFISSLYNNSSAASTHILRILGVRYVLQRDDFVYDFYGDVDSPDFISEKLSNLCCIKEDATFGPWKFFEVEDPYPPVYIADSVVPVEGKPDLLLSLRDHVDAPKEKRVAFLFLPTASTMNMSELSNIVREQIREKPRNHKSFALDVLHGMADQFSWNMFSKVPDQVQLAARYYVGQKQVVSDDGAGSQDSIAFESPFDVPYDLPGTSTSWNSYNSTLVYVQTGDLPVFITSLSEPGASIPNVVGVWSRKRWIGSGMSASQLPIFIPQNEQAILQIGHPILGDLTIETLSMREEIRQLPVKNHITPSIAYERVNPTKYVARVQEAYEPFLLVVNENFNRNWKATLHTVAGSKKIDERNHVIANGFANAWWIEPESSPRDYFTITVQYRPQYYFLLGTALSAATVLGLTFFVLWSSVRKLGTAFVQEK